MRHFYYSTTGFGIYHQAPEAMARPFCKETCRIPHSNAPTHNNHQHGIKDVCAGYLQKWEELRTKLIVLLGLFNLPESVLNVADFTFIGTCVEHVLMKCVKVFSMCFQSSMDSRR